MAINNAYMRGFCKIATEKGVNPAFLAKIAADLSLLDSIKTKLSSLDRDKKISLQRALIGGLATGAGAYMLSDGLTKDRLAKSLLIGSLGGLGTYGLDREGVIDDLKNYYHTKRNPLYRQTGKKIRRTLRNMNLY